MLSGINRVRGTGVVIGAMVTAAGPDVRCPRVDCRAQDGRSATTPRDGIAGVSRNPQAVEAQ